MVLSTVGSLSQVSTSLITDSSPLSPQDILIDPNCHDGNCNDDDDDDDDGDDDNDDYSYNSAKFQFRTSRFCMRLYLNNI